MSKRFENVFWVLFILGIFFMMVGLGFGGTPQAPTPPQAPLERPWLSPLPYPKGAVLLKATQYTQSIFILDDRDVIRKVPRTELEAKWQVSGGMIGVKGVKSDKYKCLPDRPWIWVGNISVTNSFGYEQKNRGLLRSYPNGTRFDDVLSYQGIVFEHRTRIKEKDTWKSFVAYKDEAARPPGYTGLKQSCASCHDEAGTGKYGAGLVPGSDTVISDELPWHLTGG